MRTIHEGFSDEPYQYAFPAPVVKPIQDHGVVEIMRGCPNGCRFCHAGYFYRPRRLRSVDRILEDVEAQVRIAGHREISLSSLSSGDYPGMPALVSLLNARWSHEGVSFQLPSLKVESFPLELIENISGTRKSGLTFAVETPLEQWQMTLNKSVSVDKIKKILQEAERRGYRVAKFYFMIGLPLPAAGVKEEDAIIAFIQDISGAAHGMKLNITIATFVPKPHTPFKWSAQLTPAEAASRIFTIKDAFRTNPRVKVTYHAPYLSWLEGIVARGDERVGELLVAAFSKGARFDAWDDLFRKDAWESALADTGYDPADSTGERDATSNLPWSGVSLRISRQYLLREYERSRSSILTGICTDPCHAVCGACSDAVAVSGDDEIRKRIEELRLALSQKQASEPPVSRLSSRQAPSEGTRYRLLFRYGKIGRSAYFAHHEVQSMISSAFERMGLLIAYSQGFNPMPRLEISEPLSLGFESLEEYGVVILACKPDLDSAAILASANELLHVDMMLQEARLLECPEGKRFPSLSSVHWGSRFAIDLLSTGLDATRFVGLAEAQIASHERLAGGSVALDGTKIDLLLPFAGSRDLGLPAFFQSAFAVSIRDSRVSVTRREQFAKGTNGDRTSYFEIYSEYM